MTIATRLKQAMFDDESKRRITQLELSRRSGVPQPTISRILNGQVLTEPESATVEALARACNVAFEWLRSGNGPRNEEEGQNKEGEQRGSSFVPPQALPATRFQRHWLTNEEAELLAEIRSLTPTSQKRLRTITKGMQRDTVDLKAVDKL